MRKFGIIMLLLGVGVYFHCVGKMDELPAPPPGLSIQEGWRYPYSRYQAGQYVSAFVGFFGFVLLMFPKGR
ncbi:MAG TPA: hypothetical protein VKA01_04625 [Vicinamibacteria bacterium]|nr:hypothetical protein [Vicinamibacteria bacterium]